MPKTYEIIKRNILIISSRDIYSEEFPQDQDKWKIWAFKNLIKHPQLDYSHDLVTNLIVIGDSN